MKRKTDLRMLRTTLRFPYRCTLRGLSHLKTLCVPNDTRYRRVFFGICKGNYLPLNLRSGVRMLFGIYELEIATYVRAYARPGLCCYDVGADYGYYTLAFARLTAPGQVYAFDSHKSRCTLLKQTLSYNSHLSAKVEVWNVFVCDSIKPDENKVTLDYLVFDKGLSPPDLIKMDIEGSEYKALLGARGVLKVCRPRLIVEIHSQELEDNCRRLLEQAGYHVEIVKNNPVLQEHWRPLKLNRWLRAEEI